MIDEVRKRPLLYITYPSILHLITFLDGWIAGRGFEKGETKLLQDFQTWIADKYADSSTNSFATIILRQSLDEKDALDQFFSLYSEFQSTQDTNALNL